MSSSPAAQASSAPTSRSACARRHPDWEVRALDNLRRRGGELNLPRLREADVGFLHGDVRLLDDLLAVEDIDAVVECSAEPSVLAGVDSPHPTTPSTRTCPARITASRARGEEAAQFVFLSTSRVYPVAATRILRPLRGGVRLEVRARRRAGASPASARGRNLGGLPAGGRPDGCTGRRSSPASSSSRSMRRPTG